MNKGKKIFSIGQTVMVIGAIAYIIDLLFIEAAWFSAFISAKLGPANPQLATKIVTSLAQPRLSSAIVTVLAIVFGVAIVLMLIGWIMKRGQKEE